MEGESHSIILLLLSNLNYIVVTLDVSVMIICWVSWSLLVRHPVCNFFLLAPLYVVVSIVPEKTAVGHLLEPNFHIFPCLLFSIANQ